MIHRKKTAHKFLSKLLIETINLINDVLNTCKAETKFCIAVDITASTESIKTKTIKEWKQQVPDLNKRPAIFLLQQNNLCESSTSHTINNKFCISPPW